MGPLLLTVALPSRTSLSRASLACSKSAFFARFRSLIRFCSSSSSRVSHLLRLSCGAVEVEVEADSARYDQLFELILGAVSARNSSLTCRWIYVVRLHHLRYWLCWEKVAVETSRIVRGSDKSRPTSKARFFPRQSLAPAAITKVSSGIGVPNCI